MGTLRRWIPALEWLPRYERASLPGDVGAGVTVAVMLVPQAMAYAMLAGLPPIVGLYASVFPLVAYALLGTSRQLAVGPVAMDSLLVASGVGAIAAAGTAEYVALAVLLAGMVGILQIAMGTLRLGALVSFLSAPVVSGFTSAAAIVIALSQLEHLVGADIEGSARLHELAAHALPRLRETRPITLAMGLGSIATLVLMERLRPRWPRAIAVVAVGTLVTWRWDLAERGVAIVGDIPAGLPSPRVPAIDPAQVAELLPTALTIALVAFLEAISVAKALARRHRYEVDANQELRALGAANLAGSLFGGYPVTGGFSRTAVNAQAGARTPLASVITAALIALSLALFTPLFHYLPKAVLAAIVITAVARLVDVREPRRLWRVKRSDALLLGLTFVVTLFAGIQQGIAAGVVASLALFVHRSTRPHDAVLGRLPGTTDYRNVKRYPEAEEVAHVAIWRFDASFYFANADRFRDRVDALLVRGDGVRAIVLDASGINDIDGSAEALLHDIHRRLADAGIGLYFANVKGPVREVMERGGLIDEVGESRFFFSVHAAAEAARADSLD